MATHREPQVTSPLSTVVNMLKLDVYRTLTRGGFSWHDQVAILSSLLVVLEDMRNKRARFAVEETDVSYAAMGRAMGVSPSYARRVLKPYRDQDAA